MDCAGLQMMSVTMKHKCIRLRCDVGADQSTSFYDVIAWYFNHSTVRALAVHGLFLLHGVACNASVKISKTGSAIFQYVCSSVPSENDVGVLCPGSVVLLFAVARSCQLQGFVVEMILLMTHLAEVTFMSTNLQVLLLVPAP